MPLEEYDEAARQIFAQPLPDSVQITDCAVKRTPAGKDLNEVLGCSLSVDADEFAQLLQNRSPHQRRSTSHVAPVVEVPYLADMPVTAEVHYESPPEAGRSTSRSSTRTNRSGEWQLTFATWWYAIECWLSTQPVNGSCPVEHSRAALSA